MRVYFASYQGKHTNISTTTHASNKANMGRDEISRHVHRSICSKNYHSDKHGGLQWDTKNTGVDMKYGK